MNNSSQRERARLHDDDVREVVRPRIVGDRIRNILTRQGDSLRTQALCQPQRLGNPITLGFTHAQIAPGLDMDRCPGRLQAVGHALGVADHVNTVWIAADAGQHTFAGCPGTGDRVGLHVADHLLVDPLRRTAQREFAQRGKVAGREVVADGALGLVRHIDLAVLQPLDQIVRSQVDQLNIVGLVDYRIRHRLAHPDARNPGDDVVQALDMLDVERGVDVDTGSDEFLDIHVTFGMPAAWCVGMRQFIDQRELWAARQQCVEIHLFQSASFVLDALACNCLQTCEECLGLFPSVGLDDPSDDVDAFLQTSSCSSEHFIRLAHARGGADEDLQASARFLLRRLQQCVGGRTAFTRTLIVQLRDHQSGDRANR